MKSSRITKALRKVPHKAGHSSLAEYDWPTGPVDQSYPLSVFLDVNLVCPPLCQYAVSQDISTEKSYDVASSNIWAHPHIFRVSPEQVYDVVAAIDKYPEFVPWCVRTRPVNSENLVPQEPLQSSLQEASIELWEMTAGFKWINDSYVSKVSKVPMNLIKAEAIDANLFLKLETVWAFSPVVSDQGHACLVDFQIDFEFRSYSYAYIANLFFLEVASKMVAAFEQRCITIYGELEKAPL